MGTGAKDPAHGPPLHVIAAYPVSLQGEQCDADAGPDCGVPLDAPIELRFDRFLLPSTAVRQSIHVCLDQAGENCVLLEPFYDVVERVVSYRLVADNTGAGGGGTAGRGGAGGSSGNSGNGNAGAGTSGSGGIGGTSGTGSGGTSGNGGGVGGSSGRGGSGGLADAGTGTSGFGHWLADTMYFVEIIAPGDAGDFGFRAFDGAPLEASDAVPLRYSFRTAVDASTVSTAPLEPPPPTVSDINALLSDSSHCATCHDVDLVKSPKGPPMGFAVGDLSTTAVDKVAHETAISGSSDPLVSPTRFGANMPLVAPGEPANSYLLYKLLLNPNNYASLDCSKAVHTATHDCSGGTDHQWCPSDCTAAPDACSETRLACLVDPNGSCYRAALPSGASIAPSADELRRLRNWFGAGEPMPLPYEDDAGVPQPIHLGKVELRMIQSWIADAKTCP